jgi:hypothetical protein
MIPNIPRVLDDSGLKKDVSEYSTAERQTG